MTATFLHHESCPNCGSKDNLARYSDGSAWCFGCKYQERGSRTIHDVKRSYKKLGKSYLTLPDNLSEVTSGEAYKWLKKYGITDEEIEKYGILQQICGGIYDNPTCRLYFTTAVGYQVRDFPQGKPKYRTQGRVLEMSLSYLPETIVGNSIVFVEDVVSCIKVSRYCTCVPLFGSNMPLELLKSAPESIKYFFLWLDPDKRRESILQCFAANQAGYSTRPIFSDVDPKDLSDTKMIEILTIHRVLT